MMTQKKYEFLRVVGTLTVILIVGFAVFLLRQSPRQNSQQKVSKPSVSPAQSFDSKPTDIQAMFAIVTNGTKRSFSAPMYHNLSQDAFIEAENPGVIRIKRAGITWNDFFATLPFSLTPECLTTGTKETYCTNEEGALKFYLNGLESADALDREIKQGDSLLVTFDQQLN